MSATLSWKQRLFVQYYLGESEGNAVDAARRAGYTSPYSVGHRIRNHPKVQAEIDRRMDEEGMTSAELLSRTAEIATLNVGDFFKLDENDQPIFNFRACKKRGHLIKSISKGMHGWRIVFHDATEAQDRLMRIKGMFQTQVRVAIDSVSGDRDSLDAAAVERLLQAADPDQSPPELLGPEPKPQESVDAEHPRED